jgi:hypothetical protein
VLYIMKPEVILFDKLYYIGYYIKNNLQFSPENSFFLDKSKRQLQYLMNCSKEYKNTIKQYADILRRQHGFNGLTIAG